MMVPFFFNSLFFELGEGFFRWFFCFVFVWIVVLVDRCKWIVVST